MKRDFHSVAPNLKWLTDITEFALPDGKVYLSPMLDCFDGLIISWTVGTSPKAELVNRMLDVVISSLRNGERPIIQYRSWFPLQMAWLDRTNDSS